jgi:hypothetical protein
VLRQDSPYVEWFWYGSSGDAAAGAQAQLLPGRAYLNFSYDLSSWQAAALDALRSQPAALAGVAARARTVMAAKLAVTAQLDSFAWAVARVKERCPWAVTLPAGAGWRPLRQTPQQTFVSRGLPEAVRRQVVAAAPANFQNGAV